MKQFMTKKLNRVLAVVLTIAALMTGQQAMATTKTVTYTFTAEKVDGKSDAKKLTFTPSGNQFGTNPGAKTVTIENTSNTTGFTVELDDGVILTFSRNPGYMTFSSSGEIILNYSGYNNSRFTVACTDYYIRHVKFADKSGYAFYGIGTPAPTSNALLDVDVNIDKAGNNYDPSKCYQVNSVSGSPTFGSITITLADFASGSGSKEDPYTIHYTSDLDHLATFVNNGQDYSGVYFVLSNDIAYSHNSYWNFAENENNYTAIGTYDHPFKGTFDGQGYTVSGIRIYKEYTTSNHYMDYGLFGVVGEGGTVKRVNLADAHITGYCDVGGIAGRAYKSTIEDCSVGNDVWIHAQQNSANDQGGIVGCSLSSTVRRCISRATLAIKSGLTGCSNFGGIVGKNNTKIIDCIAIGVIIPNVNGRGAIVGYSYGDNALTRNYYRDCKVASNNVTPTGVGVGKYNSATTSDPSGALALYAITLGTDVTLDRTVKATLPNTNNKTNKTYANGADIEDQPYAYATATVNLGYNSVPDGKTPVYSATNGGTISGSTLTMPASDVTVSAGLYDNSLSLTANSANASNWTTFYCGGVGYSVGNDVTIYKAAKNGTSSVTLTEVSGGIIPAGQAVILKATASPVALTLTQDAATGDYTGNELLGVDVETPQDANKTYYVLSKPAGKDFGFYKLKNSVNLGANKAYLEVATTGAPGFLGFDENTTGVVPIDNGQLTIDNWAGAWFSLDGRKLQGKPTEKGLYIVNGRKVVIK
jgi:hypothetical protein